MSKKLLGFVPGVILGASLFVSIPLLADGLEASPAPCDVVGTPFLTMTRSLSNNPDSGNFGTWATDAYTENITVWVGTDGLTYCANVNTTDGTFVTTGPQSPEAGAALASGITGTFTGGENYTFPSSLALNPSYSTTSPQTVTLPADSSVSSTGKFSWWVNDVFPSVATTDGANYVDTYYLVYNTSGNGSWTNANQGNSGDITGSASSVYVNADGICANQTPCYTTVQAGVDAVTSGGTVNVAAGTYAEDVSIGNSITLSGAGAPTTEIDGQLTIGAASTSVSGFTISNPNGNFGILINAVGSVNITANKVTNIATGAPSVANSYGIYYQSHTTGDVSGITIDNNTVNDIGSGVAGKSNGAIGIGDSTGSGVLSDVSITNNAIANVGATTKGAYGIHVNHGAASGGSVTNLIISGNSVLNLNSASGWVHAIALEAPTPSASITNNLVSDLVLSTGTDAAAVNFDDNTAVSSVSLHENNFDGATVLYGVRNSVSGSTADASLNFWGDAVDPATKTTGAGSVIVTPWYSDSGRTTLVYGFSTSTNGSETTATTGGSTTTLEGTSTSSGSVNVTAEIPAGTTITASTTWNGTIETPTATTTTVSVSGFDTSVVAAIVVGSNDTDLFFDKAVKLTFEGQAGKLIGWYNHAGVFTEITATCADNTQVTNDTLASGGSCKIDSGGDLVVWTKHFSVFVAYTQTAQTTSGGGSSSGGGNGAPAGSLGTQNAVIPTTDSTPTGNTNTDTDTSTNTSAPIAQNTSGEVQGAQGTGSAVITGSAASTGPVDVTPSTSETAATSTNATSSADLSASAANSGASVPTWVWATLAVVVLAGIGGLLFYNRPQSK